MTAIVKHISVHPKFKYARRVGIFDDLDKRDSEIKAKQNRSRQSVKSIAYAFKYSMVLYSKKSGPTQSPFNPLQK